MATNAVLNPTDFPIGTRLLATLDSTQELEITIEAWHVKACQVSVQTHPGNIKCCYSISRLTPTAVLDPSGQHAVSLTLPVMHPNPIDHPVGTKLLVNVKYEYIKFNKVEIIIHHWEDSVLLSITKVNEETFDLRGEGSAETLFLAFTDIEVLDVIPKTSVSPTQLNSDFFHHMNELRRIGKELGVTVSISLV